ncbi:MAG TPA: ATP-grasp domain-containing protein, partial [Candidatus Methanoperedens sp.]
MKLYEHESKVIFRKHNIQVPEGVLAKSAGDAENIAEKLGIVVIKAQVTVGGRGKAGGIATASDPSGARIAAERILGMSIKGLIVRKLLVEEYRKAEKEMYLGITIDRRTCRPIIMVS